jgi:hypothetical protein
MNPVTTGVAPRASSGDRRSPVRARVGSISGSAAPNWSRRLASARTNRGGDERRGEHLADAGDGVEEPGRQLVHHRQTEAQLLESIEPAIDVGDDEVARGGV